MIRSIFHRRSQPSLPRSRARRLTSVAKRATTGIRERHSRMCPSSSGSKCVCSPSFEASVFDRRSGKKIRKSFPTAAAAKAWRADASVGLRRGTMRAGTSLKLEDAAAAWLLGAQDGSIRTRSGDAYKPSALRGYEQALRTRILPDLGPVKLAAIQRADVQDLADRLLAVGLDPSTIRNALMPLRAIFRRAVARGDVAVNPTVGLELPAVRGKRDRIATTDEAASLLAALPVEERALWATALYAGLRRGELMALEWERVDLQAGLIHVERSYDPKAGIFVAPKSRAGQRNVPIPSVLREHLIAHKLRAGRSDGLVFPSRNGTPFDDYATKIRANRAWKSAGLLPIGLHESRHTFASLMIAAGVNAKALATYMGHASITITLDRYGHLFPGNEDQAAQLLDAYLETSAARQGAGLSPR
jgi:integrase